MIHLHTVELLHWDIQPHQVLVLARGITLLTGENASGKTSILDALRVALGAPRLEGNRTVEGYLSKQARDVAMIRILADNRRGEGSRRRPFDALGDVSSDRVTLGVVFRANDEGGYEKDYFLVDGDVSPLASGKDTLRYLTRKEYSQRLSKVGMTERYMKQLGMRQGRISDLCNEKPHELFKVLFDVIGGREALENWQESLRSFEKKKEERASTQRAHDEARKRLQELHVKVRHHETFWKASTRYRNVVAAIPHARLASSKARAQRLRGRIDELERDIEFQKRRKDEASVAMETAKKSVVSLENEEAQLDAKLETMTKERDAHTEERFSNQSRLDALNEIKLRVEGVQKEDAVALDAELRRQKACLQKVERLLHEIAKEKDRLEADLAQLDQGLLPLPAEVESFRKVLSREGIAHDLLYDVLEIDDPQWQPAMEGALGVRRFGVVIKEPESWTRTVELARSEKYEKGVFNPAGIESTAREGAAARLVRVRDDRCEGLIARLLEDWVPTEEDSLAPSGSMASFRDGFVMSNWEARHVSHGNLVVGRAAQERRRQDVLESLASIREDSKREANQAAELAAGARSLEEKLERQERLRQWEACQREHEQVTNRVLALVERLANLDEARAARDQRLRAIRMQVRTSAVEAEKALGAVEDADRIAAEKHESRERAAEELRSVEEELGKVAAIQIEAPTLEVQRVLDEGSGLAGLQSSQRELESQLEDYSDDERDADLPATYRRQRSEVEAFEAQLRRLDHNLDETERAATRALEDYQKTTKMVFKAYFARLKSSAADLGFSIEGKLDAPAEGDFGCDVRVGVGDKPLVAYSSGELSGGQKAALSILMVMTAVSYEDRSAGFFLVDEPFSASDVIKMNELGEFLERSKAQYLISMPTSADLNQCGRWLAATWVCTKTRGGHDESGQPVLAPKVKPAFRLDARL